MMKKQADFQIPMMKRRPLGENMKRQVDLFKPNDFTKEWLSELKKTFESGMIAQAGKVEEFEKEFARVFKYNYPVALNSGTAALEMAYHLVDIKPGDKVLTPVLTCTATNIPLVHRKANIEFVDINPITLTMDYDDFIKKVDKDTKAIVVVNLGGLYTDSRIFRKAKKMKIPVIVDAAQQLGVTEPAGDYVCYSFQAIKHFTCFKPSAKVIIPRIGRNGKMTEKIKNIQIGDNVLTCNKNFEKEVKKVTKIFERNYNGNFIKLRLSNNNEIEMTEEHPVYVIKRGWIESNKLKIGDKVLQYKYYGLIMRLNGKKQIGKKVEEIFGDEIGKNIRKKHSERMKGENHPLYNKQHSEETKKKISLSETGKNITEKQKQNMSKGKIKYWNEISEKDLLSFKEKMKILANDPIISAKRNIRSAESVRTPEIREKISTGVKKAMENPEYWINYYKGVNSKPNKSELKLQKIIEDICPNEFDYNGDFGLGVVLDRLIPDFVNINGKKKIIELFGDYWHSEKIRGVSIQEQIIDKTKRYKKCGFDSLYIMESELKNIDALKNKIENFIYNPNTEIVEIIDIEKYEYNGKVMNIETEDNHNYYVYGVLVHNCGDGGMICLRNRADYERAKKLRWFGIDRDRRRRMNFEFSPSDREMCMDMNEPGFKTHMNDIMATMGLVGLKHTAKSLEHRKRIAGMYLREFGDRVQCIVDGSYWLFCILLPDRDNKMDQIKNCGVGNDLVHLRNDIFTPFGSKRLNLPGMNEVENEYLYIPIHTKMTLSDAAYVADVISGVI